MGFGRREGGRVSVVLLLAIAVGACLFFWKVWPAIVAARATAHIVKTTMELRMIEAAAEQFRQTVGRYPTNLTEMVWNQTGQMFIDFPMRVATGTNDGTFLDPWNRRYIFVAPMAQGATGYVASFGKDGVAGGVGVDADRFVGLTNFSGGMQK